MDQKTKEKLMEVKKLIQQKNYQNALDECEIIIMKNNKIINAYLFAGFCYEKLDQDKKAEKAYLEAEDLDPKNMDCVKGLYNLYIRLKNPASTKYLNKLCNFYKNTDKVKYRQFFVKLIKIYEQQGELEMIDSIFIEMIATEKQINSDIVAVAESYFRLSCANKCFQLKHLTEMGQGKKLNVECKEKLDLLLVEIVKYLRTVAKDYQILPHQFSQTIIFLSECFPECGVILYLLLLDNYAISHPQCVSYIMNQIFYLLSAFYNNENNQYTNSQFIHTEIFVTMMILGYEYISFFKHFFTINECFLPYLDKWSKQQERLRKQPLSQQLMYRIQTFILSEALSINLSNQNSYNRLSNFRDQALKMGGFLQEVVARLAMNVFKDYKELNQMKNILKIRIQKQENNPFLMKYYYDYLIKIGKNFRVFDEEIQIMDILDTIIALDPTDYKYRIEKIWLSFSKYVNQNVTDFQQKFIPLLKQAYEISKDTIRLSNVDLSNLKKKILIIEIHLKKKVNLEETLKEILLIDGRNYQTLISLGCVLFLQNKYQEAYSYFKNGFNICNKDYHLNTFIYVTLMKLNRKLDAEEFVQKIYESQSNVFWVNYVKAIMNINKKSFEPAETYLTKAIQIFISNHQRNYLVSFEKTHERDDFSSPYLILQHQYKILEQYLIVPEQIMHKQYPLVSKRYYKQQNDIVQIKMWIQMGEILKILGRLSSSLKTLKDAQKFAIKQGIMQDIQQTKNKQDMVVVIILLQKELATVNYYYKNLKQSQIHLNLALVLCDKIKQISPIAKKLKIEILGQFFEISIQRLTTLIRFESYQTTARYIQNFKIPELECQTVLYLKPYYQFRLLSYIHNRQGAEQCLKAINKFLKHFQLDFDKVNTNQFFNQYCNLQEESRKLVKEAIEDLVVFLYINKKNNGPQLTNFNKTKILNLIQIFPMSSILYILYGILEQNAKIKTSAFLKCIKIDKYSPISIDNLANLYLKQKNFVPASKLFIKSIESNPFNMKAYYGLIICLFSISIKSLEQKQEQFAQLAKESLEKVHAFLEYLKSIDPSIQYNLIEFLKTILYHKDYNQFEKKIKIQSGFEAYQQLRRQDKFIKNTFIQEMSKDINLENIWTENGSKHLIQNFCLKFGTNQSSGNSLTHISLKLFSQISQEVLYYNKNYANSKKIRISLRWIQYLYDKFNLLLLLLQKQDASHKKIDLKQLIKIFKELQKIQQNAVKIEQELEVKDNEIQKLKELKINFYLASYNSSKEIKNQVENLFIDIDISAFLCRYTFKNNGEKVFRKTLSKLILKNPTDETLRQYLNQVLIIKHNKYIPKLKTTEERMKYFNEANEKPENRRKAYHKLCLFYNDHSGWILYIHQSVKVEKNRTKRNLTYWIKILKLNRILTNQSHSMHKKCMQLFIEIYTLLKLDHNYTDNEIQQLLKANPRNYNHFIQHYTQEKVYRNFDINNLKHSLKETSQKNKIFLALNIFYVVFMKYPIDKTIEELFYELGKHIDEPKELTYYFLLRFIMTMKIQDSTLYEQYEKLIVLDENTKEFPESTKGNFSVSFLKMNKALINRQFEQLDSLLGELSNMKLVHGSDKIIACYFDILYCYYQIEKEPQESANFQTFKNYIDHTLSMADTNFSSFLRYLNGIVLLKTEQIYNTSRRDSIREFQMSVLLNPASGKQTISKLIGKK